MSQLRQAASPSTGDVRQSSKLTWSEFVQLVLEVTVEAYQTMRQERIAQQNWEENLFTLRFGDDYIRPLTFDKELPIRVWVRPKIHTERMKSGKQATIEAKEIDMLLFDIWERDYHQKHFVWEAKRVGDKRIDPKYSILNSEYVNQAIYRFIRREYADGLSDAGVLAYVLAGNVANIVLDINQTMSKIRKNRRLPISNHLTMTKTIGNFTDVYKSCHIRTNNTNLQLHHLFLSFDFALSAA